MTLHEQEQAPDAASVLVVTESPKYMQQSTVTAEMKGTLAEVTSAVSRLETGDVWGPFTAEEYAEAIVAENSPN